MTSTQTRTIDDRAKAILRQTDALSRNTTEWDPSMLVWVDELQNRVDECRDRAVRACRDNGFTDGEIAIALGITRQAVSKRWPGGGRYVGAAGRYRSTRADADDAA